MCKSQKRGKQLSNRKFRAMEREALYRGTEPPRKQYEAVEPWELGGDGKMIYGFEKEMDIYKRK